MEELSILDIPKPEDDDSIQEPTKDIPTGEAGIELDTKLVASSNSPEDVQRPLGQLGQPNYSEQ